MKRLNCGAGLIFLQSRLAELLAPGETHLFPVEMVEFLKAVGEALAIARSGDFYKTWDTLASLRERFRERTRLGVSGDEIPWSREEVGLVSVGRHPRARCRPEESLSARRPLRDVFHQ